MGTPDAATKGDEAQKGTGSQGAQTSSANGTGEIRDAVDALLKNAVKWPAVPKADADICAAFVLGWSMADAYVWAQHGKVEHLENLPDVSGTELHDDARALRWKILTGQITAAARRLQPRLTGSASKGTAAADDLGAKAAELQALAMPRSPDTEAAGKIKALGGVAIGDLWSAEPSLGKAYLLGYRLESMCVLPVVSDKVDVEKALHGSANAVLVLLSDLASRLPANAAHSVANSLRLWQAVMRTTCKQEASGELLLKQGWSWRAVLAGEVAATDLLRLGDYVGAVGGVVRRLRDIARQASGTLVVGLVLAALLAVGGLVLLFATSHQGSVEAGLASLIAAFGLTWKGIGEFFGRAAAKGEQQLWDAELDWVIAYRFTTLTTLPTRREAKPVTDGNMRQHLKRYKAMKASRPDVAHRLVARTHE